MKTVLAAAAAIALVALSSTAKADGFWDSLYDLPLAEKCGREALDKGQLPRAGTPWYDGCIADMKRQIEQHERPHQYAPQAPVQAPAAGATPDHPVAGRADCPWPVPACQMDEAELTRLLERDAAKKADERKRDAAAGIDAKVHEVAAWCDAHPGADGPNSTFRCSPLSIVYPSDPWALAWCAAHPKDDVEGCDIVRRHAGQPTTQPPIMLRQAAPARSEGKEWQPYDGQAWCDAHPEELDSCPKNRQAAKQPPAAPAGSLLRTNHGDYFVPWK